MKELWKERLQNIGNLEERRILRDVLSGVFSHLEIYTESQLAGIEQRVFDEIEPIDHHFDIYGSLISLENYDPISDFWYPLNPEDIKTDGIDITSIIETLKEGNKPILGKFYLDMDYLELKAVHLSLIDRRFKGELVTSQASYPIEVSLSPHTGYLEQIEALYILCLNNDISWRSILHPYLYKFIEIKLETKLSFGKKETMQEITIDLEELEAVRQINQIPLWNIHKVSYQNIGFPAPSGDRLSYEHPIYLESDPHGYLIEADPEEVHFIRREREKLSIISPKERVTGWMIWQIIAPKSEELAGQNYFTNARKEVFSDRFIRREHRTIRSVGEIARIIHTFADIQALTLEEIKIEDLRLGALETYDLNPFTRDQIRRAEDKKVMKLTFKASEITPFTRDQMSFLVSEIQFYFPEFKCVGELK